MQWGVRDMRTVLENRPLEVPEKPQVFIHVGVWRSEEG